MLSFGIARIIVPLSGIEVTLSVHPNLDEQFTLPALRCVHMCTSTSLIVLRRAASLHSALSAVRMKCCLPGGDTFTDFFFFFRCCLGLPSRPQRPAAVAESRALPCSAVTLTSACQAALLTHCLTKPSAM